MGKYSIIYRDKSDIERFTKFYKDYLRDTLNDSESEYTSKLVEDSSSIQFLKNVKFKDVVVEESTEGINATMELKWNESNCRITQDWTYFDISDSDTNSLNSYSKQLLSKFFFNFLYYLVVSEQSIK